MAAGVGGFAATAVAGLELVEHGVLPGKRELDKLAGDCSSSGPSLTFAPAGPSHTGHFFSARRDRTIAYPPGHPPGSELPLAISLHGFGGTHASGFGGVSLANALAARQGGRWLPPFALVSVSAGHPAGLVRSASRWAATARSYSPRSTPG